MCTVARPGGALPQRTAASPHAALAAPAQPPPGSQPLRVHHPRTLRPPCSICQERGGRPRARNRGSRASGERRAARRPLPRRLPWPFSSLPPCPFLEPFATLQAPSCAPATRHASAAPSGPPRPPRPASQAGQDVKQAGTTPGTRGLAAGGGRLPQRRRKQRCSGCARGSTRVAARGDPVTAAWRPPGAMGRGPPRGADHRLPVLGVRPVPAGPRRRQRRRRDRERRRDRCAAAAAQRRGARGAVAAGRAADRAQGGGGCAQWGGRCACCTGTESSGHPAQSWPAAARICACAPDQQRTLCSAALLQTHTLLSCCKRPCALHCCKHNPPHKHTQTSRSPAACCPAWPPPWHTPILRPGGATTPGRRCPRLPPASAWRTCTAPGSVRCGSAAGTLEGPRALAKSAAPAA